MTYQLTDIGRALQKQDADILASGSDSFINNKLLDGGSYLFKMRDDQSGGGMTYNVYQYWMGAAL